MALHLIPAKVAHPQQAVTMETLQTMAKVLQDCMDLAAQLEADLAVLPQLLGPLMVLLAAAVVLVFLQPMPLI